MSFPLSYVEQENLLPRSSPPEIPNKTPFPFFFLFVFIQNYSFCCPPLSSRLAIWCATLKRQTSVRGTINKFWLVWTSRFPLTVFYLFINQANQAQLHPGLNEGWGWDVWENCEIKGQVTGAPFDMLEPNSKLDNWKMLNKRMSDLYSINKSYII